MLSNDMPEWILEQPDDSTPHDTYEQQRHEASLTNMAHLAKPLAKDDSQDIFTDVGSSSLFVEHVMDVENNVYDPMLPNEVWMSDEVLTDVGGMSLFVELGLDSIEEIFSQGPSKDTMWDGELVGCVLITHIGGMSMLLEQIIDTHPELEREIDNPTCLYHGLSGVELVFRVVPSTHEKLKQLLSRDMLHGSDIALFLPLDPDEWISFVPGTPHLSGEHQLAHDLIGVFSPSDTFDPDYRIAVRSFFP